MDDQKRFEDTMMEWEEAVADGEEDFLAGKTCNPDAPEECESCQ